jgi:hypothetical protein
MRKLKNLNSGFVFHPLGCEALDFNGPLRNLTRLLVSEAWHAKATGADLTILSRDSMRRNVATNENTPHIQLTQ